MCGLMKDALSLVNRQKAEIERLTASVERLADESDARDIDEYNMVCRVRAEAVKEFAERLKDEKLLCAGAVPWYDIHEIIDNLVKEMVGDDK